MRVRAVTPRVVAISGHVQVHHGYWDADGYDLAQDSRWDDIAGSDYHPDPSLHDFSSPRGSYSRRAHGNPQRVEPTPMNGSADHTAGLDGRSALPTSSTTVAGHPSPRRAGQNGHEAGSPSPSRDARSSRTGVPTGTSLPLPDGTLGGGPDGADDQQSPPGAIRAGS